MALRILPLSSVHLSYIQNNLGSGTEFLRILESYFDLNICTMLDSRVQSQDERQCNIYSPLNRIFIGFSHPLSIISLVSCIHINSLQICDCPSLPLSSTPPMLFPYDLLRKTLIPTSPLSRSLVFFSIHIPKKPLLPSFSSLSPLYTQLLMLIGFL